MAARLPALIYNQTFWRVGGSQSRSCLRWQFSLDDTPEWSAPSPAVRQTEGKMDGEILYGGKPREQRGGIHLASTISPNRSNRVRRRRGSNEDEERFREKISIDVSFPPCYWSTFHGVHGRGWKWTRKWNPFHVPFYGIWKWSYQNTLGFFHCQPLPLTHSSLLQKRTLLEELLTEIRIYSIKHLRLHSIMVNTLLFY